MSERPRIPADYTAPGLDLDDLNEQPVDDAFPRLSSAQIDTLAAFGERRPITPGQPLFAEGAEAAGLRRRGQRARWRWSSTDHIGRVHGPGSFIGELALLRGETLLTTPVGAREGEVVIVPAARFTEALAADLELRDIISRAYLLRRSILLAANAGIAAPVAGVAFTFLEALGFGVVRNGSPRGKGAAFPRRGANGRLRAPRGADGSRAALSQVTGTGNREERLWSLRAPPRPNDQARA